MGIAVYPNYFAAELKQNRSVTCEYEFQLPSQRLATRRLKKDRKMLGQWIEQRND
jgi:hypothetical protein